MKQLEINNQEYTRLLEAFSTHLKTVNYSKDTVYNDTNMMKEYVHFLIENNTELKKSDSETIKKYLNYLQKRSNQKRGGGLSIAYMKKHVSTLKRFYSYLHLSQYYSVTLVFPMLGRSKNVPNVLSFKEIKQLFAACDQSLLGIRNKAVLSVYYGLGLRRSEGVNLLVSDIDFAKEEVFISKSKTRKQRIVPMNDYVKDVLEDYVYNVREKLVPEDKSTAALLVTQTGKALSQESVSYIVRNLVLTAKISTKATPHTLRHSIATHLLQANVKLEDIALFLGHTSLDSTQIYTHLSAVGAHS